MFCNEEGIYTLMIWIIEFGVLESGNIFLFIRWRWMVFGSIKQAC